MKERKEGERSVLFFNSMTERGKKKKVRERGGKVSLHTPGF